MQPRFKSVQCFSPCGPHTMAYKEWGREDNPDILICVHGLTRVSDDFDMLAQALSDRYRILCPDIVGRGRSSWLKDATYYVLPVYVNDVLRMIAHERIQQVSWLGTSMGGLIGMSLAAMHKSPIRKLILNDIGPSLNASALTRIGSYLGEQPEFASFDEAARYIRGISASFGSHDERQWTTLASNVLRQGEDGKWRRNHDPGIALPFKAQADERGRHVEKLLWAAYDAVSCPTMVIRGRDSDLLTQDTAREMTQRGPKAELVELDGIGHAPMFMHPEQIALVSRFLGS